MFRRRISDGTADQEGEEPRDTVYVLVGKKKGRRTLYLIRPGGLFAQNLLRLAHSDRLYFGISSS